MKKKAVVIGGGLGGISAAISLRYFGYDVELHEKNGHLGGKLNLLKKEGFSFDLGPSILTFPHIFERLFDMTGKNMADALKIVEPDVHWRCFFEDGERIDLLRNVDDMEQANPSLTTHDVRQLNEFLDYSRRLYQHVEEGYFDRGVDNVVDAFKTYGIRKSLTGFDLFSTMHRGVRRHISHEHLAHVMDFFVKYVGSSPYDAPAVLNMIPYGQFQFGLWYIHGGMYELARALQQAAVDMGINIRLNSEISELLRQDNRIAGAMTTSGERIEGDVFVSNMEVIPAYRDLLGETTGFLRGYEKFAPACSGLVLHLGVREKYEQLAHHNFFFSNDPEKHFDDVFRRHRLPEDPTIYLVAPSRTDPSVAPQGCDNLKILPHIPFLQDPPFSADDYGKLRQRVLAKLERMGLENLTDHIMVEDMWTPEDIRRNYYSHRGAIYGVVSDRKKNLGFKAPKRSRKYGNLFFVGGSVNPGGGMPMVALSGLQAAQIIRDNG